jgi:hypothetical protein
VTVQRLEFVQEADEILQAAAEAIDGPCCDHVDLARRGVVEQSIEARTLVAAVGARDAGVLVDADDLPARALSNTAASPKESVSGTLSWCPRTSTATPSSSISP